MDIYYIAELAFKALGILIIFAFIAWIIMGIFVFISHISWWKVEIDDIFDEHFITEKDVYSIVKMNNLEYDEKGNDILKFIKRIILIIPK